MYGVPPYSEFMALPRRTTRERKSERLELRVSPSVRKVIEQATAVTGLAVGDLAFEGALRMLDNHERMVLRAEDRQVFLDALTHPPPPKPRLIAAFRTHRKLTR